jgi:WD40 repeat protein
MIDLKTGRDVLADEGHRGAIRCLDVSADGSAVATAGADGLILLWDVKTGKQRRLFEGNGTGAITVTFSPDGRTVATSAYLSDTVLWDAATGKALQRFPDRDNMWGSRAGFSADGKSLAVVSSHLEYRFYNPKTGELGHTFGWYTGPGLPDRDVPLRHVPFRFSPDGKHFAGLYAPRQREYAVALWDMGKNSRRLLGETATPITDLAFSPDGEYLAWADREVIHLWDVRAGRELKTFKGEAGACLAFTPDGRYLVGGKHLHPLSPRHPPRELPVRPGHVGFSRDGSVMAAVPQGGTTVLLFDGRKFGK